MKNVLIIAHHFPPMGGPGVGRSINIVNKLPQFGYRPIVLTISYEDIKASQYPPDESLLSLIEDVTVVRVGTGEPRRIRALLTKLRIFRLFWVLFYPFFWETSALWPAHAFRNAKVLIHKFNISLIYSTSGPFSSILLGFLLKKSMNIKWVADIRDPFTDGYMWRWPSKVHWLFSRYIERFLLRYPDKVVVNTPATEKLYRKRGIVDQNKLLHLTNGFEC